MLLLAVAVNQVLCAVGAVQVFGLIAAAVARLAEGTRHERGCQWLCILALGVVGMLCGFAIQYGPDAAAACAVTLMLMTMISVVDLRSGG